VEVAGHEFSGAGTAPGQVGQGLECASAAITTSRSQADRLARSDHTEKLRQATRGRRPGATPRAWPLPSLPQHRLLASTHPMANQQANSRAWRDR